MHHTGSPDCRRAAAKWKVPTCPRDGACISKPQPELYIKLTDNPGEAPDMPVRASRYIYVKKGTRIKPVQVLAVISVFIKIYLP